MVELLRLLDENHNVAGSKPACNIVCYDGLVYKALYSNVRSEGPRFKGSEFES